MNREDREYKEEQIKNAIYFLKQAQKGSMSNYVNVKKKDSDIHHNVCHAMLADKEPWAVVTDISKGRPYGDLFYDELLPLFNDYLYKKYEKKDEYIILDGEKPGNVCLFLAILSRRPWEYPKGVEVYCTIRDKYNLHPMIALYLSCFFEASQDYRPYIFSAGHDCFISFLNLKELSRFILTKKFNRELTSSSLTSGNTRGVHRLFDKKSNKLHKIATSSTEESKIEYVEGFFKRSVPILAKQAVHYDMDNFVLAAIKEFNIYLGDKLYA